MTLRVCVLININVCVVAFGLKFAFLATYHLVASLLGTRPRPFFYLQSWEVTVIC